MKTKAQSFYESIKDNPKEIIKWAKGEIREYERLIKIIEKGMKLNKKTHKEV